MISRSTKALGRYCPALKKRLLNDPPLYIADRRARIKIEQGLAQD